MSEAKNVLDYLVSKYNLNFDSKTAMPIAIPNVGRNDLAQWLNDLNFKIGVEVGVAEGIYSEILCKANPQMTLYGVDAWQIYQGYDDYVSTEGVDYLYQETLARMKPYSNYRIIKKWSHEAATEFKDNSIDFVYIDANHSNPFITQDIVTWSQKVRKGGIVSGHDYVKWRTRNYDVINAVHTHTLNNQISPYFVLGLKEIRPG